MHYIEIIFMLTSTFITKVIQKKNIYLITFVIFNFLTQRKNSMSSTYIIKVCKLTYYIRLKKKRFAELKLSLLVRDFIIENA